MHLATDLAMCPGGGIARRWVVFLMLWPDIIQSRGMSVFLTRVMMEGPRYLSSPLFGNFFTA